MVTVGCVIGFNNIWWLPILAGEYGGGLFWIAYAVCLFVIGLPVLIAELGIGAAGDADPVGAVERVAVRSGRGRRWQIVGWLSTFIGLMLGPLYLVAASWCAVYAMWSVLGGLQLNDHAASAQLFVDLIAHPAVGLYSCLAVLLFVLAFSLQGAVKGLGLAARIGVPTSLALLVGVAYYSQSFGDTERTFDFLIAPDWRMFDVEAVGVALIYALFSVGIGKGILISVGRYIPAKEDVPVASITIVVLELFITMLAGYVLLPLLFAANIEPAGGIALLFVGVPLAFSQLPQAEWMLFALYTAVIITAVVSLIALLESPVSVLVERFKVPRWLAVVAIGFMVWLLSASLILSLADEIPRLFYQWNGWVVVGVPATAILTSIFMAYFVRPEISRAEFALVPGFLYWWWLYALRWISIPASIVIVVMAAKQSGLFDSL